MNTKRRPTRTDVLADTKVISQLVPYIRMAKKIHEDIEYQVIGAFDEEVRLAAPFKDFLGRRG